MDHQLSQAPSPVPDPARTAPPDRAARSSPASTSFKALGDNTRYAIYLELARSPIPLSTADIADVLGLHVNTVRPHLERMREVGLLDVATFPRGEVGRPQHRYSLAADAPSLGLEPSPLPTLARALLAAAHAAGLDPRRAGRRRARAGSGAGRPVARGTPSPSTP